jgi:Domain of unknown function (DUF5658)
LVTTNVILDRDLGGELNPVMRFAQTWLGVWWLIPKLGCTFLVMWLLKPSGNEIHASSLDLRRFKFLSNFDAVLIGLNRSSVRVFRFVCDESDFCLTNDGMGRVCRTYRAHVSLPAGVSPVLQGFIHTFLRGSVNGLRDRKAASLIQS